MKTKTFKLGRTRTYPLWWVPTVEVRHADGTLVRSGTLTVSVVTDLVEVPEKDEKTT